MFKNFFYPETICIPGASSKEKSIGYELLKTIKSFGYTGKIFPVNPSAPEILGYKCYPSIEVIEEKIDLAIVMVPKRFVLETTQSLLKKGVKSIILITAGFKETGEEGKAAEEQLLELIRISGARMVGPNCMGIISSFAGTKLNATFVAEHPKESNAAFLSQSGALGAAVLNSLRETNISFGHFISVGNKADVNENDLLDFWRQDENISAVAMYLESFVNGEDFISRIADPAFTKPLVVLKAGKTAAGMKAASSHTGALGSSDRVVQSVLNQFGIIRADSIEEMFNTLKGYESFPLPKGRKTAIVTNAGGPSILCVDALEKKGLELSVFSETTKAALRAFVHPEGSINNPVDLLPGGSAEQFKLAVETVLADNQVDAVISIFVEPVMVPAMPVAKALNEIQSPKPVYKVVMPLPEFWEDYNEGGEARTPIFRRPEDPAPVIANLLLYSEGIKDKLEVNENLLRLKKAKPLNVFAAANTVPNNWLNETAVKTIIDEYSIPQVPSERIKPQAVHDYVPSFGYPIVLKGTVPGVTHKSDLQLVEVNIPDKLRLSALAAAMTDRAKSKGVEIVEFMAQPFLTARFELLVGGFRDPSFGPMIMFGSGGKYVEIWNDTAMRSAYLNRKDIAKMISEVKIGRLLNGVRGEKAADIALITDIIYNSARMMLDHDEIVEFDFNPLIVDGENKLACVDARIKVR